MREDKVGVKPALGRGGNTQGNHLHYNKTNAAYQTQNEQLFREEMRRYGVEPPLEIIADGQFHRFASTYKKKSNADCRYVFHGTHGYFCDWFKGIEGPWSILNDPTRKFTEQERLNIQKRIKETDHQVREEERLRHEERAQYAQTQWESLSEQGSSEYLKRKKVEPFGVRFSKNKDKPYIAIPVQDSDGKIWNIQRIFDNPLEEIETDKIFMKGARKKGLFHIIGTIKEGELFYICEGFATGSSIHMATGKAVIVAFDCYNLVPVTEVLRTKYPTNPITICADDDCYKNPNTNPGRENAEKAADMFKCGLVLLKFKDVRTQPTDFNDLQRLEGLDEVKRQLEEYSVDEWPEPELIRQELLPVESLPPELIPEAFRPWLEPATSFSPCSLVSIR